MAKTKYGVFSTDSYYEEEIMPIIEILLRHKANSIIINGVEGERQEIEELARTTASTGVPISVNPRGNVCLYNFFSGIESAKMNHGNINSSIDNPIIFNDDHQILLLPGATKYPYSKFLLQNKKPSGTYELAGKKLVPTTMAREEIMKRPDKKQSLFYLTNIEEELKKIKMHENTIVISYAPGRFSNIYQSVDVDEIFRDENGIIYSIEEMEDFYAEQLDKGENIDALINKKGYSHLKKHVGSRILKKSLQEKGIHKTISSHPPYSTHVAHNSTGSPAIEDIMLENIHLNTGIIADGCAAIIDVEGKNMSYKKIDLFEEREEY